jgi:xanthine dehydrogenase accessory factor
MDNPKIFERAAHALESGQHIALVTVVATSGSTPGKTGYKMLVPAQGGDVAGTVGGGLIEAKMIEEARRILDEPSCRVFRFDLGETPDDEKGICGGTIELLVETFDESALPLFKELSAAAGSDAGGVLVSIISPDRFPRKMLLQDVTAIDDTTLTEFTPQIAAAIKDIASGSGATKVSAGGLDVFIESMAKSPAVVLFGAGHLSSYIARYVKSVHFRVTVCDDRAEYANRERFPGADEIVVEDFGRVFETVQIDADSYIVIVTRGHKFDQIVLEQVLRTEALYIGMIGSRRKTQTILEKLRAKGIRKELLDRVYSPIGVSIGAVTPQEIALSIVCELVKIRRLGPDASIGHMTLSHPEGPPGDTP